MQLYRFIRRRKSTEPRCLRYRQSLWARRGSSLTLLVLAGATWLPGTAAHASNRSVFGLGDGNGSTSLVVPYYDADSFITIKNVGIAATTITIEYRDLAGSDQTPGSDTFVLFAQGTLRWAPASGSSPSLDSMGNPIPVMLGPATDGSAILTSTEPLAGQVEVERFGESIGYTLAGSGGSTSLVTPYLRTGSTIVLRNVGGATANYAITYRDLTGSVITTGFHSLAVGATERFAPFTDEPGLTGSKANAIVTSDQPLVGQLELTGSVNNTGYTLQSTSGSTLLAIPYVGAGSFIALTNVGAGSANLSVEYRDPTGNPLVTIPHTLGASVTERWAPFADEPGLTGTEANAIITSDQPLRGHLELSIPDGSTAACRLPDATLSLAVPYMRAGSTIRIKADSGATATVTVTYRGLDGTVIAVSPRSVSSGVTDAWDPFVDEPGLAGFDEASALIASDVPLAGQLELAPRGFPAAPAGNLPTTCVLVMFFVAVGWHTLSGRDNARSHD